MKRTAKKKMTNDERKTKENKTRRKEAGGVIKRAKYR